MVNAVQEEDSSSARDSSFFLESVTNTSSGLVKMINSEGVSFFSRPEYFEDQDMYRLEKNLQTYLSDEQLSSLLTAVQAYAAELVARKYLGRAEHSKYQLKIKLRKKDFASQDIKLALDYLEAQGVLDDSRFARAWLNTRRIYKKEGRIRLSSELMSRGINFEVAQHALNEFFEENSELSICQEALERQLKKGFRGQKLMRAMSRLGFSSRLINICLKEKKGTTA